MKTTRRTTKQEKEVMEYLNSLRTSGITNMFGATPYVINNFNIEKKEASRIVSLWMDNFNEDGNYENITIN